MSSKVFQTIPTDLIEHAEAVREYFKSLGYKVSIEPTELGFPSTPALLCKRTHTTIVVEVCSKINQSSLRDWSAYCRSNSSDVRIAICVPDAASQKELASHQAKCKELGVGIYVSNDTQVNEWMAPRDISLNLELPDIGNLPLKTRKALGSAYEQFDRGQWREGFEEACKAIESKAKPYLIKALQTGRLKIYEKGVPKNPTKAAIMKMTLGALAVTFSKAQPLNVVDSTIYRTLEAINPNRVGVAHKVHNAQTEKQLRKHVGAHMHAIVQALKVV
jgi:hypothetical protein